MPQPLLICGHFGEWLCRLCGKCDRCCECTMDLYDDGNALIASNSRVGVNLLARLRKEAKK